MRPGLCPAARTSRDRRRGARWGDWLLPGSTSPQKGQPGWAVALESHPET